MKDILSELNEIINLRKEKGSANSYTKNLIISGSEKCAEKFGEEAVELIIAASSPQNNKIHIQNEAADVIYHLMVLLSSKDINLETVLNILEQRMGTSGLDEKTRRKK